MMIMNTSRGLDDDDDDDDDGCHRARDVFFVDLQLGPGDLLYFSSLYIYIYMYMSHRAHPICRRSPYASASASWISTYVYMWSA